jgi:hypothetical protein
MVVLERFCCSRQGDVRPIGGEVKLAQLAALCTKIEDVALIESDPISVQEVSRYWEGDVI